MSNRTATKQSPDSQGTTPAVEADVQRVMRFYDECNVVALRDEAIAGIHSNHENKIKIEQVLAIQDSLRAKCDVLTGSPNFEVVITGVSLNGKRTVEVIGSDNQRVHVDVHGDVSSVDLKVGVCGLVTRERNCLLSVLAKQGPWSEIGTFQQYLGEREALLTDHHRSVRVTLTEPLAQVELQKGDLIGYDGHASHLAYTYIESATDQGLFDPSIKDNFSQLGGMDHVIVRLKQIVDFKIKYPEIAARYRLGDKHGVLLYGPPGNGKTRIARCLAAYADCSSFMHISGSQDYSQWFGETEGKIIQRFNAVRKAAERGNVVVFFDEIDAIGRRRGSDHSSGAPARILNTLLSQLDGIKQLTNVLIVAATNRADTLDEGLIRPGRFDEKVEIRSPNRDTATSILRCYLNNGLPIRSGQLSTDEMIDRLLAPLFTPNGDLGEVAHVKTSDGRRLAIRGKELLSGAMLESVVATAARQAAVRAAECQVDGIAMDDLVGALASRLRETAALLNPNNIKNYVRSIPQDAQPIAVDVAHDLFDIHSFIRN